MSNEAHSGVKIGFNALMVFAAAAGVTAATILLSRKLKEHIEEQGENILNVCDRAARELEDRLATA